MNSGALTKVKAIHLEPLMHKKLLNQRNCIHDSKKNKKQKKQTKNQVLSMLKYPTIQSMFYDNYNEVKYILLPFPMQRNYNIIYAKSSLFFLFTNIKSVLFPFTY